MNRGIRNNNPLNIRRSATRWKGAQEEQRDKAFVQFKTLAYGYRAAWKILQTYYERFPHGEQAVYGAEHHQQMGTAQEERYRSLYHPCIENGKHRRQGEPAATKQRQGYGRLSRMMAAMTCMECGISGNLVDDEAIAQGYKLAFPKNKEKLDEWLTGEDEYSDW